MAFNDLPGDQDAAIRKYREAKQAATHDLGNLAPYLPEGPRECLRTLANLVPCELDDAAELNSPINAAHFREHFQKVPQTLVVAWFAIDAFSRFRAGNCQSPIDHLEALPNDKLCRDARELVSRQCRAFHTSSGEPLDRGELLTPREAENIVIDLCDRCISIVEQIPFSEGNTDAETDFPSPSVENPDAFEELWNAVCANSSGSDHHSTSLPASSATGV